MPRKPGIQALEGGQTQVLLAIGNNFDQVALHLRNERILTPEIYQDATAEMLPNKRVKMIFQHLNSMVAQNDDHFLTFVKILHTHTNSKETVDMLVSDFRKKGGDAEVVKKLLSGKILQDYN